MSVYPCNFRKVLLDSVSETNSNLYRSDVIDEDNYESSQWLRETIGINTYLDFREKMEICAKKKLTRFFIEKNPDEMNGNPNKSEQGYRYRVEFLSVFFILKVILFRMGWIERWKLFLLLVQHLFYRDHKYKTYILYVLVQSKSLDQIYCAIIDDFQNIFKKIFLLMLNRNNFPMVISCSFGKDRTGIVAALVMQLFECSDKLIIEEYSKSEVRLLIYIFQIPS